MDQKKIQGRVIAFGRVTWLKYGEKEDQEGYVFNTNNGFGYKVDQKWLADQGVNFEALKDCVDQLEEKGSVGELKAEYGHRLATGPHSIGLVLTSRKDPRIICNVVLADDTHGEFLDLLLSWYLDVDNEKGAMEGDPEKAAAQAEVKSPANPAPMEPPISEEFDQFGMPLMEGKMKEVSYEEILGISEDFDDEETFDEPEEPDDEDAILSDSGPLGRKTSASIGGKHLGEFDDEEEAKEALRDWMTKNNFYPNVWRLSDHGNYHKITI